jgi:hypothetical protein
MKTCSKCGAVKPVEAFRKGRAQCKECVASYNTAYCARYYSKNRDELLAKQAEYRSQHIEEIRERDVKYAAKHREKIQEYSAKYYSEHEEKTRAQAKKWYYENYERARQTRAQYHQAHLEKDNARSKVNGKKARDLLSPCYLAQRVKRPVKELSPEILAMQRAIIISKRITPTLLKELNHGKSSRPLQRHHDDLRNLK